MLPAQTVVFALQSVCCTAVALQGALQQRNCWWAVKLSLLQLPTSRQSAKANTKVLAGSMVLASCISSHRYSDTVMNTQTYC